MHIRGFDGLRALAVILVLLMHKTQWGASAEIGYSGVWLFFLLSGFLIAGQLHSSRSRIEAGKASVSDEFKIFWIKRALRIFPAYYLLISLLAPFYLLSHRANPGLPYYLAYLSNFFFQSNAAEFQTTWAHFWSLAVEQQFYLIFALLLLFVPSRYAAQACILVIVAAALQRFNLAAANPAPFVIYVDSLVNFGALGLGALLAIRREDFVRLVRACGLDRGFYGWAAAAIVVVLAPLAGALAGTSLLLVNALYLCGTFILALLMMNVYVNQETMLVHILEWRPIAYLGQISYGLYLYNDYVKTDLPERLLRFVSFRFLAAPQQETVAGWMQSGSWGYFFLTSGGLIVCFGVIFMFAHLSWLFAEQPCLRLRKKISARALESGTAVTSRPLQQIEPASSLLADEGRSRA